MTVNLFQLMIKMIVKRNHIAAPDSISSAEERNGGN